MSPELRRFLLPSLLGVVAFLLPVTVDGEQTIVVSLLTDLLKAALAPWLLPAVVLLTVLSVIGGAYYLLKRPEWEASHPYLHATCNVTPIWLLLRIVGAAIGVMVLFETGPLWLRGPDTGELVFLEIGVQTFVIFLVACQFMPFLTEYGFMEFVGVLLKRSFERLFRLPGRSAIDALASFVSSATVGLLITIGQYERGYYSARESASIATNFSVVSIPFSLVVANVAGVGELYFSWYLSVIVACLICALVMVRIPPLSRLSDDYFPPVGRQVVEAAAPVGPVFTRALAAAVARASNAPGPREFLKSSSLQTVNVIFVVIPAAMTLATATAVLLEYTSVFDLLAWPVGLTLSVLGLPEAQAAAPGFIVGFFDQFMPAVVAAQRVDSTLTRFVLAGLSVTQLIYMAEVGVMLLRSSLPLNFGQLFVIFLLRTLIVTPILILAGVLVLGPG
ncbi:MAG: nucleoside recognition domain-containing protein [Pseudomonadota bacterium]